MLFVDGENFTIRAQRLAQQHALALTPGSHYEPDVFVWLPAVPATLALTNVGDHLVKVQRTAIRSYYYTSAVGDDTYIGHVRARLWDLGFHPEVFKKSAKHNKTKGVDIALTKDVLSHAFLGNYQVALLVAGDADYVPLVQEVKRLGKLVYVAFFEDDAIAQDLRLAADRFFGMREFFLDHWRPAPSP
jgi:uncharacterized LabA/DUF88 family protein